jgi:hypothetical protein
MIQTKTKTKVTKPAPLKGRPMGGKIGEFQDMIDKAKRGDRQAEADLKLERAKLKTFGEGPGAGASGAMPQPKKKMGGAIKKKMQMGGKMDKSKPYPTSKPKAKNGTSLGMKSVKAGYDDNSGVTRADFVSIGTGKAKMGKSVKKAQMGATMTAAPMMMKKGGMMKKCKSGCK